MPSAISDNVGGHRKKYDFLKATLPAEEVGKVFVGGTDPIWMGYFELEIIRKFRDIRGATLVDIGCGIGRLTRHVMHEPIERYLGLDVIPEILQEAIDMAKGDDRFTFEIGSECKIPMEDNAADVVVAFSVITHLLDEETFEYFQDAWRVLKPGGVAIFSFLDYMYDPHVDNFFRHASEHRHGHGDLLKFSTKEVLHLFGKRAGFSRAEFIDGVDEIKTSGQPSALLTTNLPRQFHLGQSACILTK